jgi:Protein of unknown function (DUF732)
MRATTTIRWMLTAFIPAFAALPLASPATADSTDSTYLNGLAAHGIGGFTPAGAINEGHHICSVLDDGYASPKDMAVTLTQWFDSYNISFTQAAFWVGDAIGAYCPWHAHDPFTRS